MKRCVAHRESISTGRSAGFSLHRLQLRHFSEAQRMRWRPTRRFTLKALLLFTALAAVVMAPVAWQLRSFRSQNAALAHLLERPHTSHKHADPWPQGFWAFIERCLDVSCKDVTDLDLNGAMPSDEEFQSIERLSHLRSLNIPSTTDD